MSFSPISPAALFDLSGRTALVTGGSVSIGRAIALQLAAAGADVAIQFSPQADAQFGLADAASETCAQIVALLRRGIAIAADFAEAGAASRIVAEAATALGRVDILVICASIQSRQPFEALSADEIARMWPSTSHRPSSCCKRHWDRWPSAAGDACCRSAA